MFALALISALGWFRRFGGLGLIAVGIADASLIPMPGSVDVLTIVLAASNRDWWPYYAALATVGAVMGGSLTYRLGRKGGQAGLEKRLSHERFEQVRHAFEKGGFGAIFVPALLPPPVPMVPFVLAAGAAKYPCKKFLLALTLGRAIRYTVIALLASIYGRHILGFIRRYQQPVLWIFIALVVLSALWGVGYYFWRKGRSGKPQAETRKAA